MASTAIKCITDLWRIARVNLGSRLFALAFRGSQFTHRGIAVVLLPPFNTHAQKLRVIAIIDNTVHELTALFGAQRNRSATGLLICSPPTAQRICEEWGARNASNGSGNFGFFFPSNNCAVVALSAQFAEAQAADAHWLLTS